MKTILLSFAFFFLLSGIQAQKVVSVVGPGKAINPYKYSIVKKATYAKAAVSSAHPLASQVGALIMKQGGNAFDAAIATQLALAVVFPGAGNLGGGGFLLARRSNGELLGLDYREAAPAAASRDMYLDAQGNANISLSQNGHLASGIPGTVAGLFATMPYAKLPFAKLVQPAIDLAEYGFVVTEREASSLNSARESFLKYSTRPTAFTKEGRWKAGDTLVQKELAATLKRMQKDGAAGFYEGETAKLIVEEMQRGKGIITYEDLKSYTAKLREPIQFKYRDHEIISFAPPSSGGILIAQMMKMIEKFPMNSYGFQTAASVQLMIEAERRAYADRAQHMGDPDFWKVPVDTLMSEAYLTDRMKDYDPNKAGVSTQIKAGVVSESEETTHLSVIDATGNLVAVTTTLNGGYGSRTVVGGAGFLLNNEMDDFSVKPGVPNMYGALGGEANAIVPGKRMLSSMTPTLMLKNKKPYLTIGTPGGTTIPTSVFQALVNLIDFKMDLDDAINKPKFHHQWFPDEVVIERDFLVDTKKKLEAMGYRVKERSAIGRTEGIRILSNGQRESVADKRGDDSVAGF
ncbi:MAG: gamma-glutamyltransferase [Sediminibacterium sp. Gen4]|jgi:gamma-glutamyltranspeptidase/glutathione hydrolase|uniref:gamma-glutamyltransferase n=1 Tax=unclassified Sediminibacterium TaxID=2635961 RepID=UPI0015C13494|nr:MULTISPECIES: gamma-glutamyltransferase [unclassified Sediminibacterium]MBW0160938.1 gamma-glutamyltransferase [Sediminibacterium sp.]MBW0165682.1 gamma-glutamyltransferase [Sediminibacterium sp.]NWK64649.1 gamma-glutamyltransferase [Sediminibacterium sp. Gen4]